MRTVRTTRFCVPVIASVFIARHVNVLGRSNGFFSLLAGRTGTRHDEGPCRRQVRLSVGDRFAHVFSDRLFSTRKPLFNTESPRKTDRTHNYVRAYIVCVPNLPQTQIGPSRTDMGYRLKPWKSGGRVENTYQYHSFFLGFTVATKTPFRING